MRIAFAGTPVFAATALAEMLRRNQCIVSVLTQPDAQSGRGLKSAISPVKQLALQHNVVLQQPATLKDPAVVEALARLRLDVLVVVAYGLILPPAVLALPRLGCVNVHASLLPRWRGAAPIQRALMAGDTETGVCIMRMDAGLDTGPVYERRVTPVQPDDTFGSLHDRLAKIGAEALCDVLRALEQGQMRAQPQPDTGVTYAAKISKSDCRVEWHRSSTEVERLLRSLDPAPGAHSAFAGQVVKLWRGRDLAGGAQRAAAGTIVAASPDGVDVQCGEGVLRITELQRAGGRRMPAMDFQRGFKLAVGDRFGD